MDRWAGAFNPHSHSNPPPTLKHTQKSIENDHFPEFELDPGWTVGPTDKASFVCATKNASEMICDRWTDGLADGKVA